MNHGTSTHRSPYGELNSTNHMLQGLPGSANNQTDTHTHTDMLITILRHRCCRRSN